MYADVKKGLEGIISSAKPLGIHLHTVDITEVPGAIGALSLCAYGRNSSGFESSFLRYIPLDHENPYTDIDNLAVFACRELVMLQKKVLSLKELYNLQ